MKMIFEIESKKALVSAQHLHTKSVYLLYVLYTVQGSAFSRNIFAEYICSLSKLIMFIDNF